jgi:hypothetical protein
MGKAASFAPPKAIIMGCLNRHTEKTSSCQRKSKSSNTNTYPTEALVQSHVSGKSERILSTSTKLDSWIAPPISGTACGIAFATAKNSFRKKTGNKKDNIISAQIARLKVILPFHMLV